MTDRAHRQAWLIWLGLGLSLAIHIGVAARLLSHEARDFGATDITTTAISVNIEATDILDAVEQSAATDAAEAPASPPAEPATEPEPEPKKAEEPPARSEPEKLQAETPPPPSATEQQATEDAKARQDEALARAAETERETQEAERRTRDKARERAEHQARAEREAEAREEEQERRAEIAKQAQKKAREKRAQTAASAGASGSRGAKASTGRVSASQGALQNYKGIVNAWMARNKPPHGSARGDVIVLIALSPSGGLISARIMSSSGNQTLDQTALAAARRSSPFPTPPAGSTASQLRFTFPYRFQ